MYWLALFIQILKLPLYILKEVYILNRKIFNHFNLLHPDNYVSTILVFGFFWTIGQIPISFLDPVGDAFADVELTDVFFSRMGKNEEHRVSEDGTTIIDTNVVLVNIGFIPRGGIANLIDIVNYGKPKVVGLDVFFRHPKDSVQDSMLALAFSKTKNLVLVSEGNDFDPKTNSYKSYETSWEGLNRYASNGLANMVLEDDEGERDLKVCRKFIPTGRIEELDSVMPTFAVKLCELYAPEKVEALKKRSYDQEIINFYGNIHVSPYWLPDYYDLNSFPKPYYQAYDYTQLFHPEFDPVVFKNKIVILGFLGERIDKDENADKFYTPLNDKYIGKANKDMYGVVVHCNIISTILSGEYIDQSSDTWLHILGVFCVFLTFASFRPIYNDYKIWYDGITKVLALGFAVFVLGVQAFIFWKFNYQLRFGAVYFACILISGDFLEIYYGLLKNFFKRATLLHYIRKYKKRNEDEEIDS